MRICALAACLVTACTPQQGSLELSLSLPTETTLRPSGMTTVTVTATFPGESPLTSTAVIDDGTFTASDLPIGEDVQLGVVLRDVSNRIVGVGEAGQTIDLVADEATQITIPVRKPFVYASGAQPLVSFDTTLDPRMDGFQGMVAGVTNPLFTISVGGDRLAVVTSSSVLVIATDTNAVTGTIAIPSPPRDATAVPGTHKVAVAHATGITIVDLDASSVATAMVGPIDRVTAGPNEAGALYAYGLVGRVAPAELPPPMGACTSPPSSIVAIEVDNPTTRAPRPVGATLADIAAAPDAARLVGADPCSGQVVRVTGDPTAEVGTLAVENIAAIERAAVLTVAGNRIWAAGTDTAVPFCEGPPLGTCSPSSAPSCTATPQNDLGYANEGATLIVASISLDGSDVIRFVAPDHRETMLDRDDGAEQHAQVLKALSIVPIDLVTLPGGQFVSVIAQSKYFIVALLPDLPCLEAMAEEWMLFDLASSAVAQRVRTFCEVEATPPLVTFPNWKCGDPPLAEQSKVQYHPTSVGALFGAR
ncbi:MAG: hypothetical protein AB7T06_43430 [Kofleriaceae bacterium]